MDYKKYKNARNASWQCILDYGIKELPIKITDVIEQSKSIQLFKNSQTGILKDNESGITILDNDTFNIIYKDSEPSYRCRFTLAHELGHIFMGDLLVETPKYRTFAVYDDIESVANIFARDLLAPACILWALNLHTPQEIARLCDISITSARIRAERMKILYQRNKFLSSSLETQVYQQFLPFINGQKDKV